MGQQKESDQFRYWRGEDENWPVTDWKYAVANDDTRLGYWEWVESGKESRRDEPT